MSFEDDMRFEEELRRACKAEDPGDAFTRRVLDRVNGEAARPLTRAAESTRRPPASVPPAPVPPASYANWRVALAFAASLSITIGSTAWMRHARYVEEGARARAQVLTALRLTSEKLNVVRSAVIEAQEPH
jgi:hypothetical protein